MTSKITVQIGWVVEWNGAPAMVRNILANGAVALEDMNGEIQIVDPSEITAVLDK